MIDVALRLKIPGHRAVGPGKIRLLELIHEHGSISAAGREMEMAYSHAWTLVDSLNRTFGEPVVAGRSGGNERGGAQLTPFGTELVRRYRTLEQRFREACGDELRALERSASPRPSAARPSRHTP
ncbi:MAG TPA: winged helix-turn-helix domain-containing protein [Candidatus Baltobacteraceae bacterium]|nr:winged helix-turn-helix domain-containing protein [Candidatus Baltobacteraceae bacterium]